MKKRLRNTFLWITFFLLITLVVFSFVEYLENKRTANAIKEKVLIMKVIDGDTLRVQRMNSEVVVRLIGIDAPELQNPKECFSVEAKNEAEKILNGKEVYLENDPTQDEKDKYGRLLRYVYLEDGENISKHMIERGFAREYDFMGKPYTYRDVFEKSENEAKNNLVGLWGGCK